MLNRKTQHPYTDHLGPDEVYPGLTEAEASRAAVAERRNALRAPVIKSARIIVGDDTSQSVFNCLVLDESPIGVLVDLGTLIILPAQVRLQLAEGATYLARRVWGVGTRVGLEFIGRQIITGETALRMMKIADVLATQGVAAAMATLRGARFFGHEELRVCAEALEGAYERMEAVLTGKQAL